MAHYNTWTLVLICVNVFLMGQLPLKIFHNITLTPGPLKELSPCWVWGGAKTPEGYGLVRLGVVRYVHTVVYELLVGPISARHTMVNACRRDCCNPEHWKPMTRSDAAKQRAKWEVNRRKLKRQLKKEKRLAKERKRLELAISDDDWCV